MKEKDEQLNESLKQDQKDIEMQNKKSQKPVIIGVLIIILIIFIVLIILILFLYDKNRMSSDDDQKIKFPDYIETSPLMYGTIISNISYSKNNTIINTFKEGGDNYNEELGNINNGNDYNKNDRNIYTLFIPYSATKKKDKYNRIILFIHGVEWNKGNKEYLLPLAQIYAQNGHITAIMDYTLLSDNNNETNIFRILDEITACIDSIKNELKNNGFNENKLEIALGGDSTGSHITLLYSYSIYKTPLPIKFVINIGGPVTLESKFWKKLKKENDTLNNIEPDDITQALNESKIIDAVEDDFYLLNFMNNFLGKKFSKDEINQMLENKKIKEDNIKYKELINQAKYTFPIYYAGKNIIPTLCIYGGNDSTIGVAQYAYLKNESKLIEDKIVLIYSRYADHCVVNYKTEDGINAMREMYFQILNFSELYFSSN